MAKRTCSIGDCERPLACCRMCWTHYERFRKYGSTDDPKPSIEERFWAKVDKTDGCWNWIGSVAGKGYGHFRGLRGGCRAHRFAYELLVGPIPDGLYLDHICQNRRCVNPDHLRPATPGQNIQNHSGAMATSKSGVRGVYRVPSGKWRACVRHEGKAYDLGRFVTLEAAEAAVVAKRNEIHTHNDRDRGEAAA